MSCASSSSKRAPPVLGYGSNEARARYEAYSRLQATALAFGEQLSIPEIVAVGGQSDGKSSLLEALLGFRFNVREVEMGTRRPLVLQMIHEPAAVDPRCRLQHEDDEEYGPVIVPHYAVAEAIKLRTEEHLKKIRAAVSSKPIVMRVEYAYCPNLTIIDTPGFILKAKKGEPESTPDDILQMVRALALPPNRLLLFLQQSSVEWCSSLWLDTVRSIDPGFHRTVVVVSKFDNRLGEFAEKWEVDRYLSAGGYLGDHVRPFFVALPKDRGSVTNEEFRSQIASVDAEVLKHLRERISGGFSEDKYSGSIGFGNLRNYLEAELQRRYREAAPATLALLERRCNEVAAELATADAKLSTAGDIASLRKSAMIHTAAVAGHMVCLLHGAADLDPLEWGLTTDEERVQSGAKKWPGLTADIQPPNAILKLYGGASFERVLTEFKCAACSLECPSISRETVANVLLAHVGRSGGTFAAAASIARAAAQSWLGPLLDTVCDRLGHVLRNLFDLAVERIRTQDSTNSVTGYVAFQAAVRQAHDGFVQELVKECKGLVRHELAAITSPYSHLNFWENSFGDGITADMHGAVTDAVSEELENHAPQGSSKPQAAARVSDCPLKESQLTIPETPSPEQSSSDAKRKEYAIASGRIADVTFATRKRHGMPVGAVSTRIGPLKEARHSLNKTKSVYDEVCSLAIEQFTRIREVLVERSVPAALNAGFLTPCQERLALALGLELFAVSDEQFMDMFVAPGMLEQLENERASLQKRYKTLRSCLHEFRTLARSL
ncbi:hypothetical protein SELMODRAFT_113285 [Selaginella moellendorffii]|uniref:Dynamin-type G domain-containing protein n=1 Tax=Selaginella moellendorffii TaxID=88036 RepID=D8SBT3_SELML|nr:hypothetical protein SELMODRAFT_113285 [Selaginella moellendorffii]